MHKAAVALTVAGGLSLDGFDELVETIRETAYPRPSGRTILVSWEAPTQWELAVNVQRTKEAVESNYFGYCDFPDIEEPGDGTDTNLARFQVWDDGPPRAEELKRLARYRTLAHSYLNIVTCPSCSLPKADGYICICGYDL